MEKAFVVALALHAVVAFVPIGSSDAPKPPRRVVRLHVRATTPAPPRAAVPRPRTAPITPPALAHRATLPAPRPRAQAHTRPPRRAVVSENAPTVTRARGAQETAAGPPATASAPEAPSIETTATNLGTLGDGPPAMTPPFAAKAYGQTVRALMARHKRYPRRARRRGIHGVVIVSVSIDVRGGLTSAPRVRRSSGSDELDREGLRMARSAAPFPSPIGATGTITIDVPVRFSFDRTRSE